MIDRSHFTVSLLFLLGQSFVDGVAELHEVIHLYLQLLNVLAESRELLL